MMFLFEIIDIPMAVAFIVSIPETAGILAFGVFLAVSASLLRRTKTGGDDGNTTANSRESLEGR